MIESYKLEITILKTHDTLKKNQDSGMITNTQFVTL